MSYKKHSLGGVYPYKMDAKCRVSIPSDWRNEIGNSLLRLLVSHNEKIPTLKVLTESEFDAMCQSVHDSEKLSRAQKTVMLGTLFERSTKAQINEQGKLSIPKALLDHPGLTPGKGLVLCGRGGWIEILNEENYEKLCAAREATIEKLDKEFGFF